MNKRRIFSLYSLFLISVLGKPLFGMQSKLVKPGLAKTLWNGLKSAVSRTPVFTYISSTRTGATSLSPLFPVSGPEGTLTRGTVEKLVQLMARSEKSRQKLMENFNRIATEQYAQFMRRKGARVAVDRSTVDALAHADFTRLLNSADHQVLHDAIVIAIEKNGYIAPRLSLAGSGKAIIAPVVSAQTLPPCLLSRMSGGLPVSENTLRMVLVGGFARYSDTLLRSKDNQAASVVPFISRDFQDYGIDGNEGEEQTAMSFMQKKYAKLLKLAPCSKNSDEQITSEDTSSATRVPSEVRFGGWIDTSSLAQCCRAISEPISYPTLAYVTDSRAIFGDYQLPQRPGITSGIIEITAPEKTVAETLYPEDFASLDLFAVPVAGHSEVEIPALQEPTSDTQPVVDIVQEINKKEPLSPKNASQWLKEMAALTAGSKNAANRVFALEYWLEYVLLLPNFDELESCCRECGSINRTRGVAFADLKKVSFPIKHPKLLKNMTSYAFDKLLDDVYRALPFPTHSHQEISGEVTQKTVHRITENNVAKKRIITDRKTSAEQETHKSIFDDCGYTKAEVTQAIGSVLIHSFGIKVIGQTSTARPPVINSTLRRVQKKA